MEEMVLIGYFHFESKEKKQIYYVVQALHSDNDVSKSIKKGTLINIFVPDEDYKKIISSYDIGSLIKVDVKPNFETGKLSYRVIL